jgi:hypothetical protein
MVDTIREHVPYFETNVVSLSTTPFMNPQTCTHNSYQFAEPYVGQLSRLVITPNYHLVLPDAPFYCDLCLHIFFFLVPRNNFGSSFVYRKVTTVMKWHKDKGANKNWNTSGEDTLRLSDEFFCFFQRIWLFIFWPSIARVSPRVVTFDVL